MKELVMKIIMYIVTLLTYFSYIPQIIKLLRTKQAEDISITSWLLWVSTSVLCLAYIQGLFTQCDFKGRFDFGTRLDIDILSKTKDVFLDCSFPFEAEGYDIWGNSRDSLLCRGYEDTSKRGIKHRWSVFYCETCNVEYPMN